MLRNILYLYQWSVTKQLVFISMKCYKTSCIYLIEVLQNKTSCIYVNELLYTNSWCAIILCSCFVVRFCCSHYGANTRNHYKLFHVFCDLFLVDFFYILNTFLFFAFNHMENIRKNMWKYCSEILIDHCYLVSYKTMKYFATVK